MARRPKKKYTGRRFRMRGRYIKGNISVEMTGGTLAAQTVLSQDFDEVVNERTLVSSIVHTTSLTNWTRDQARGPISYGVAHSDYTTSEIQSYIQLQDSWDEGNLVQREVANRRIRKLGFLDEGDSKDDVSFSNDNKPMKTKLNWILNQGQTLKFWIYNHGAGAFTTTDPKIKMEGHANLWPR